AFGRGKGAPPAPLPSASPAGGQSAPVPGQKSGLLGLGRGASSRPSNEAPRWIGPREGGLPELATGAGPDPLAAGAARDIEERLRKLRHSSRPGDGDEPWERRPDHLGSRRPE